MHTHIGSIWKRQQHIAQVCLLHVQCTAKTKKTVRSDKRHTLTLQLFLGARLNLKHTYKRRCWSALYAILSTRQCAIKCTVHTTYKHTGYSVCVCVHALAPVAKQACEQNTQCVYSVYAPCVCVCTLCVLFTKGNRVPCVLFLFSFYCRVRASRRHSPIQWMMIRNTSFALNVRLISKFMMNSSWMRCVHTRQFQKFN